MALSKQAENGHEEKNHRHKGRHKIKRQCRSAREYFVFIEFVIDTLSQPPDREATQLPGREAFFFVLSIFLAFWMKFVETHESSPLRVQTRAVLYLDELPGKGETAGQSCSLSP